MMRILIGVLLIAMVGACASPVAPLARPMPTVAPSAFPTVATTPSPTPNPASALVFGDLTYDADACWGTFTDAQGHRSGGVEVRFKLPVRNPTKAAMRGLSVIISETNRSRMLIMSTGWAKPRAGTNSLGELVLTLPPVKSGKTTVTWSVAFLTPFDPHYRVSVTRDPTTIVMDELVAWSAWTSVSVC